MARGPPGWKRHGVLDGPRGQPGHFFHEFAPACKGLLIRRGLPGRRGGRPKRTPPAEGRNPRVGAVDLALIDWSDDGHPRLLGRLHDADLVEAVRARLAAARRRELSRLENPVRLVSPASEEDDG